MPAGSKEGAEAAGMTNSGTSSNMQKSTIIITCPKAIPPYLKQEVLALGLPAVAETIAGIETEGTLETAMRLNLFIRTGHRVLYLLEEFQARNADELYSALSKIPWEDYLEADEYLCVTSSVDNPTIRDSRFANVRCKDAIVDRLNRKRGRRPDSGPERTGAVINLYWKGDRAWVYLDTSGEPLSRRGYRKIPLKAPMQESLAAAVLLAAGWDGTAHARGNFINPMCGSGTLAIEAALLALNKAPGLLRGNFGFMHLKGFHPSVWQKMLDEAKRNARPAPEGRIVATDISAEAVAAARQNAQSAGVDPFIEFGVCDYSATEVPPGGGILMVNPEYGERMGQRKELEDTYRGIGDFFKKKGQGYRGFIFTGNLDLAKKVGLRAKRRIPFFNSNIECRLLEYELYAGTREPRTGGE